MSDYPYITVTDELIEDHAAFVKAIRAFMEWELSGESKESLAEWENMADSREAPGL